MYLRKTKEKQVKRLITYIITGAIAISAMAAPIDEVRKLYREGNYAGASARARTILRKTPKNGNANYFLGASLVQLGNAKEAIKPLEKAVERGVADASRILALIALDDYKADEAIAHLNKWEATLNKAKKDVPDEFNVINRRATMMLNMLDRVERIVILDSLSVDSATFFETYRLSAAAGKIMPAEAVTRAGIGGDWNELSLAYMPQNKSALLWAAEDSTDKFQLYGADILDDGTVDHAMPLGEELGEGGNAKYPFLMPDGLTLYFANDGENSLGGYDIFMTRRNEADGGYYKPQNIGMPYNSPANDYMLAIDETSGIGWWATDRNADPGMVTIYIYTPSSVRQNADTSDPHLASLAKLDNIKLTREEGVDYPTLLEQRLPVQAASILSNSPARFCIDMGDGTVYTSLNDFNEQRARSAMLEALASEMALTKHLEQEQRLRLRYRNGDESVANDILDSEAETARLRLLVESQRNNAVRLEGLLNNN